MTILEVISRSSAPVRRDAQTAIAALKQRALDAGDVALAKTLHRFEGELLAEHDAAGADVVDLGEEKRRRLQSP